MVRTLLADHTSVIASARLRAMLDYAVKLTVTPGAMIRSDVQALRDAGLGDRDILDVNQVTAYFAYVNRVADGLGVATDDYAVREHAALDVPDQ